MAVRLMEIELRVADVERSRHFYRDLIGVSVGELETHGADSEQHCHATWGDWSGSEPSFLMLNIYPADEARRTVTRFGFVVPDLAAVHDRLRRGRDGRRRAARPAVGPDGHLSRPGRQYRVSDGGSGLVSGTLKRRVALHGRRGTHPRMRPVNERCDFRVAAGTDRLVRRAAESADKTLTDFVLDAAMLEAERVLAARRHFELAPKQWARFVEILDRPPRENPGLKRLLSRPSVFVQE